MSYFIPDKLYVGFQKRSDTYTEKLSFSTYIDEKTGDLKHKDSWNEWCDKEGRIILDNKPMKGFMFNMNVVHRSNSYNYKSRKVVFRIYHPQGFEFEIKPENVNMILEYTDVSRKEIIDECIIAFTGKTIILLPITSPEYKDFLKKQENKNNRDNKDLLKKLVAYRNNTSSDILLYCGKYDFSIQRHHLISSMYYTNKNILNKYELFYNLNSKKYEIYKMKDLNQFKDYIILEKDKDKINIPKQFLNFSVKDVVTEKIDNSKIENIPKEEYKNIFFRKKIFMFPNSHTHILLKNNLKDNPVKDTSNIDKYDFFSISVTLNNGKVFSINEYLEILTIIKSDNTKEVVEYLLLK